MVWLSQIENRIDSLETHTGLIEIEREHKMRLLKETTSRADRVEIAVRFAFNTDRTFVASKNSQRQIVNDLKTLSINEAVRKSLTDRIENTFEKLGKIRVEAMDLANSYAKEAELPTLFLTEDDLSQCRAEYYAEGLKNWEWDKKFAPRPTLAKNQ